MKISEMQDELENLGSGIMAICEMIEAIGTALDQGGMNPDNILYAMSGIAKNARSAAEEIEELTKEFIKIRDIVNKL